MKRQEWNGFVGGLWEDEIDVRNFIQKKSIKTAAR